VPVVFKKFDEGVANIDVVHGVKKLYIR
jgi:hypothetical protein